MNFPDDLRYTQEHEWVRVDGTTARVGITDYAQDALGDVVYVDLPQVDTTVAAMAACCEVISWRRPRPLPRSSVALTLEITSMGTESE